MMSTMPYRTAPRTRATIPEITRTTASIHKMNAMSSSLVAKSAAWKFPADVWSKPPTRSCGAAP